MNQDDEQRRSRLVIQTENTQREVTPSARKERNGLSLGVVIGIVLGAMMLTALVILALMNRGDKTTGDQSAINANVNAQPIATTPFPAFTPPTNIAPTPQTTLPPVANIAIPPASTPNAPTPNATPTPNLPDDATLQANVNKLFFDDPALINAEIDTSVSHGKVTLRGKVKSANLKLRAEKLVKTVRGVQSIDDKITVEEDKGGWTQTTTPENPPITTPTKP